MLQALIILLFMAVHLRDEVPGPPLIGEGTFGGLSLSSAVVPLLAWLLTHIYVMVQGRHLDRRGEFRAVRRAERAVFVCRIVATLVVVFGVLALGWLDSIRAVIGDVVALDEILAGAPAVIVIILGWWSLHPIERRVRSAVILREAEAGRAIPQLPPRWATVWASTRHQIAIILLPIVCIMIWGELVDHAELRGWLPRSMSGLGAHFVGLALILTIMPTVMRRVWDTVALGQGPLRESLSEMCRAQRVRVRELLLWRTHGAMVNGAVMGFIAPLRYILLTDALIESLPARQVEAVTAHELGHVRRRHILWLAGAAIGSMTVFSTAASMAVALVHHEWIETMVGQVLIGSTSVGTAMIFFGYVSRRFEWQADAFAVQHLSGHRPGAPAVEVTLEAVESMSGALESVATLNNISKRRFTWRHGSIWARQERLSTLVGRQTDQLPIDRQARRLMLVCAILAVAAAGLLTYASVSSGERAEPSSAGLEHGGLWCDS